MSTMKGPAAVKEVTKAQLFEDDKKYGAVPHTLKEYAKKFTKIQLGRTTVAICKLTSILFRFQC